MQRIKTSVPLRQYDSKTTQIYVFLGGFEYITQQYHEKLQKIFIGLNQLWHKTMLTQNTVGSYLIINRS